MKQKTIVHMTSVHRIGDTRIYHRECASLLRAGYHVIVITAMQQGPVQTSLPHGLQIIGVKPARTRLGRIFRVAPMIFWSACRTPAGLYHFHDPELLPFGLLLRLLGRKVIYDVHEDYRAEIAAKEWLPKYLRSFAARMTSFVENFATRIFDGIVGATPHIASKFPQARHCATVCNFPSKEDLPVAKNTVFRDRRMAVIYVGDITQQRGIYEMLGALAETRDEINLVLGGGFSPPEMFQQCQANSSWPRVEFKGWLSRAQYARELSAVRAGLILFHRLQNHLNSLPNKLFEYMSAGIPVIASDFPLWREMIEGVGCGILVEPADLKATAEAITWLVNNPDKAEEMGEKGRVAVERHYNWYTQEQALLELYNQVLQSG